MAKYTAINAEAQKKYDKLFDECGVFWAFSDEQFEEGKKKHPINRCKVVRTDQHLAYCEAHNQAVGNVTAKECEKQEKYVSIGAGGFLPKANVNKLKKGLTNIKAWKKQAVKEVKAEEAILYELRNYECFYTGEITDALEVLKPLGYTEEQVKAVYHKHAGNEAIN